MENDMKRNSCLPRVLMAFALLHGGSLALAQTIATGGAGGTFPPATFLAGVNVKGIQVGFGADVDLGGVGRGQFCAILAGTTSLGAEQIIKIEGEVTAASQLAPNVAVLSGTATIDLGAGLPPTEGVPFTATMTTNTEELGTIGLVTGLGSLPNATLNVGSLTIR
jgi:hypothetical protein